MLTSVHNAITALLLVTTLSSEAGLPPMLHESVLPSAQTVVFGVASGSVADVVMIESGLNQGFRTGAACRVSRKGRDVAEIVLVEVLPDRAAGLLTSLAEGAQVKSGDVVTLKPIF